MRFKQVAWTVFRVLFGLFFIYSPIMVLVSFGGQHPPETAAAAENFTQALNATGFMNPLLMVTLFVGGVAILFDRTAPVGLLLVAPSVVVIGCFHWLLTHDYVWGSIWPVWFAVLAWHYRGVFARLLERRP